MSTSYTCPVEGCDYGEQESKSLAAVRAHINALNDPAHDWSELKSEVVDQGEQGDDQQEATTEGGGSEAPEKQTASGDSDPSDGADEYDQQWNQATDPSEGGDDQGDPDPSDGGSAPDDPGAGGGGVPVEAIVGGTIALGALVVLVGLAGNSNADPEPEQVESEVSDAEPTADPDSFELEA
ncbi:hypothetical protein ACKVMT_09965 [Halobacteriales archaeon Cl-PHB]